MPHAQPTSPSYHDELNSLIGESVGPFPPELAKALDFWLPTRIASMLREWVEAERQAVRDDATWFRSEPGRPDCPQCGELLANCQCTKF